MGDYQKLLNGIELQELEKDIGIDPISSNNGTSTQSDNSDRFRNVPGFRTKFDMKSTIDVATNVTKKVEHYFFKACWIYGYIIGAMAVFSFIILLLSGIWMFFISVVILLNAVTNGFLGIVDKKEAEKYLEHLFKIFFFPDTAKSGN